MAKKKNGVDYWLNRVLGVFLSEDRIRFYLLGIFILGFVLRLIGAMNLGVSADDMHFSVHAINFLSSGKLVTYDQSASLWYYVTDVFYRMFGLSQLTSRMAPLLFGSFSIFIIFFLANEFFGKKAGLVAAFLLAISPYHIKYTISEMDIMAMFFVLFALLLFVWALKENKSRFFAFSGVLLGLAILTKVYTLLFIPVLLVYALYFNKKEKKKLIDKKLAGKLFYFLIVAFLFAIPSLTHNYLLYKDKGFVDLIYTNALGIGKNVSAQYYSWDSGWGMGADWHGFFLGNSIHMGGDPLPSSLYPFEFILYNDPIALIFGILGLAFLLFRKRWEYPLLFLFVLVFVFSYLAARILLAKHYAFLLLFLIMPASFLISGIDDSIKRKFPKFRIRYVLVALLFLSLVLLGLKTPFAPSSFYSPSEVSQMMSYKNSGIPQDALIVGDSRIYRGEIHWMFQGREYIESSYLAQLLSASQQTGKATPVDVY